MLPSFKDGLALLLKGLEGLVAVLGRDDTFIHLILLVGAGPRDGLQRGADRDRPALANLLRQADCLAKGALARGGQNIGGARVALVFVDDLDEAVGEAEEVGLGRGDAPAGEDEVAGAAEPDKPGQAVGAASTGQDAEARLGQPDGGVGGEHAEVGGEGEFKAAAEREGGDGGDAGDGEVGKGGECSAEVGEEVICFLLAEAATLFQIRTRAKARVHGAGNDEGARWPAVGGRRGGQLLAGRAVLGVDGVDLGAQGGEQALGDGVAGRGPVELEDANVAGGAGGQVGDADERLRLGRVRAQRGDAAAAGRGGSDQEADGGGAGESGSHACRATWGNLGLRSWRGDCGWMGMSGVDLGCNNWDGRRETQRMAEEMRCSDGVVVSEGATLR